MLPPSSEVLRKDPPLFSHCQAVRLSQAPYSCLQIGC